MLFSDIHCHQKRCQRIVEMSLQADVVIGAGDFACQREGLRQTFQCLEGIEKPFIIVPGNNEDYEQLQTICANKPHYHLLHGSGTTVQGVPFYGVGGGIPITPFGDWSYDFSEDKATTLLADCPSRGVLITHSPPKGVVDNSSAGQSLGSTAVRQAILDKHPLLNVCGHIHGSSGKNGKLGTTAVINAGPLGIFYEIA